MTNKIKGQEIDSIKLSYDDFVRLYALLCNAFHFIEVESDEEFTEALNDVRSGGGLTCDEARKWSRRIFEVLQIENVEPERELAHREKVRAIWQGKINRGEITLGEVPITVFEIIGDIYALHERKIRNRN